jgi:hypothetical protein
MKTKKIIGYLIISLVLIFPFRYAYMSEQRPGAESLLYFLLVIAGIFAGFLLISSPFKIAESKKESYILTKKIISHENYIVAN